MSRHDDPNPHDYQMEPEAVSPNRPPNLNESNCRHRCGLGCCEPQRGDDDDGGGGGSDTTSTVIGSDDDVGDLSEPWHAEGVYEHSLSAPDLRTSERQPGGFTYRSEEDLRFSRFLHAQRCIFISSILNRDELDSLCNEATTRSQSSASSEVESAGNMSQDGLVIGIGTWNDDVRHDRHDRLPGLFRKTPLRLSPNYEDCRGPSLSHLNTQDVSTLLNPNGRWGVQGFSTTYTMHDDGHSFAR